MNATINQLFDFISSSPVHTDVQMSEKLGIGIEPLRWRLGDLQHRGILRVPIKHTWGWVWTSWFETAVESQAAAVRSGLAPDTTVRRMPWTSRFYRRG